MNKYRNTADDHRVWPTIQRPDGTTLELDPSETVELDLPESFSAPFLDLMKNTTTQKSQKDADKKEQKATEAEVAAAATNADKENQS